MRTKSVRYKMLRVTGKYENDSAEIEVELGPDDSPVGAAEYARAQLRLILGVAEYWKEADAELMRNLPRLSPGQLADVCAIVRELKGTARRVATYRMTTSPIAERWCEHCGQQIYGKFSDRIRCGCIGG